MGEGALRLNGIVMQRVQTVRGNGLMIGIGKRYTFLLFYLTNLCRPQGVINNGNFDSFCDFGVFCVGRDD